MLWHKHNNFIRRGFDSVVCCRSAQFFNFGVIVNCADWIAAGCRDRKFSCEVLACSVAAEDQNAILREDRACAQQHKKNFSHCFILLLLVALYNIPSFSYTQIGCSGTNAYLPCNLYQSELYLSCRGTYQHNQYVCACDVYAHGSCNDYGCVDVCGGCGELFGGLSDGVADNDCKIRYSCYQAYSDSVVPQYQTYNGLCDVAYVSFNGTVVNYCNISGCSSSSVAVSSSSSSSSSSSAQALSSYDCYDGGQPDRIPLMCTRSNYDPDGCAATWAAARATCHASCHPFVEQGNNSLGWNGGCIMGKSRFFYDGGYFEYYYGCEGRIDPELCGLSSGGSSSASGGGGDGGSSGSGEGGSSGSGSGGSGGGEGGSSGSGSGGGSGDGEGGIPCGYPPYDPCDVFVTNNPPPDFCVAHRELCESMLGLPSDIATVEGTLSDGFDSLIGLLHGIADGLDSLGDTGGDSDSGLIFGIDSLAQAVGSDTTCDPLTNDCGTGSGSALLELDSAAIDSLPAGAARFLDSMSGMFEITGGASGCPRLPNIEFSYSGLNGSGGFSGSIPLDICAEHFYIGGSHVLELIGRVFCAFTSLLCFIALVRSFDSSNGFIGNLSKFRIFPK